MKDFIKRSGIAFAACQLMLFMLFVIFTLLRIPDTLILDVESDVDYSVQVGYLRPNGSVRQHAICPQEDGIKALYLPVDDPDRDRLSFGICSATGKFKINRIILNKWYVIPFELEKSSLLDCYKPTAGLVIEQNPHGDIIMSVTDDSYFVPIDGTQPKWRLKIFSETKFLIGILAVEFAFLLCSCLISIKRREDEHWGRILVQSAILSLLIGGFFCLILPLQSYLVNRVSFPYSLIELMANLLCGFISVLCIGIIVLTALRKALGPIVLCSIFGIVLYCYLATGVMSAGLPALDGDFRFFAANRGRGIAELVVLLICTGSFAITSKWVDKYVHWFALGLLAMAVASLFDVRVEKKAIKSESFAKEMCSFEDIARSGFWSSNGNVIVLVPDSVSTELARGVLEEDANISAAMEGFTLYSNNIGMHNITPLGLPGLITGNYLDDLRDLKAHQAAVAGENSFIYPYVASDNPVFISLDIDPNFRWTNRLVKDCNIEKVSDNDISILYRRINDLQAWNLFEIVRFRLTPFIIKYQMAFMTMKDWPMYDRGSSEKRLYPKLEKFPIKDDKIALHLYHTEGCHFPFQVGKHGERLPEPLQNYEGMYNKTYFAFENIAKLLNKLKEKDVYDKSLIIICADHGANHTKLEVPVLNGMTYEASKPFPVLMVKPIGAGGLLKYSNLPVSHTMISRIVREHCAKQLAANEMNGYLHCTNRMYVDFDLHNFSRYEYFFDVNGNRASIIKVESE